MISYDLETIRLINLFEKITGANVKDCIVEESSLTFIVMPNNIGKAIGKGGSNIRKVSSAIRKQVRVIEFDEEPCKFVSNLLYPIKPAEIKRDGAIITIKAHNTSEKGRIFGREKTNFKKIQEIVSKYYPVEIRVE